MAGAFFWFIANWRGCVLEEPAGATGRCAHCSEGKDTRCERTCLSRPPPSPPVRASAALTCVTPHPGLRVPAAPRLPLNRSAVPSVGREPCGLPTLPRFMSCARRVSPSQACLLCRFRVRHCDRVACSLRAGEGAQRPVASRAPREWSETALFAGSRPTEGTPEGRVDQTGRWAPSPATFHCDFCWSQKVGNR